MAATAALEPRGVDRLEPGRDQVLADRLQVDLGEELLDVAVGCGGDPLQDGVGVVVAGLDALEVEDRETAETRELAGHPHVDDGVHRGGQDRDLERDAAERLREVDVRRLDRVRSGRQRDVLEAIGGPDRVDLGMEDAPAGRGGGLG